MAAPRRGELGRFYRDVKKYARLDPFAEADAFEVVWVDEKGRWYGRMPPDRAKDKFLPGGVARWWVYRGPASTWERTGEYPAPHDSLVLTLLWHQERKENPIKLRVRVIKYSNAAAQQQHYRMTEVHLSVGDYVSGRAADIQQIAQGNWRRR